MSGRRSPFKKDKNYFILQERDKEILYSLYQYGVLTNDQIKSLLNFGCLTRVNIRLRKLYDNQYLSRLFLSNPCGQAKILHFLGSEAVPIISEKLNLDPKIVKKKRNKLLKIRESTLKHFLLINQFRVAFVLTVRSNSPIKLTNWKTQKEIILSAETKFYPDAYFSYLYQGKAYNVFLEVDRFLRSNHCFQERIKQYLKYGLEGYFNQQFHYQYFKVLIVCSTRRRLKTLLGIASRFTEKVFWFGLLESITPEKILTHIWWRPRREGLFSLLEVK